MTTKHRSRRSHFSLLSLLGAHRLKATVLALAAGVGLLANIGVIDARMIPEWAKPYIPDLATSVAAKTPDPALPIADGATLRTCYTPGEDCTGLIVGAIDGAKSELLVQAYGFTSRPIVSAIGRAKARGVDVRVILDKSNESEKDTGAAALVDSGITPLVDDKVAIAHNKVMVIDQSMVVTGSFNFTEAAQKRNAENVLIVAGDADIAKAYRENWQRRAAASHPYPGETR